MSLIPSSTFWPPAAHQRNRRRPALQVVASRDSACGLSLRLVGALPSPWLAALSARCAAHGISLMSGHAARDPRGVWTAEFQLESLGAISELPDFAEWATSTAPEAPNSAKILDFDLFAQPGRGETLVLEVHAWEAVGVLASVLADVGRAGLVPVEVLLETEDECAFHQITLAGAAGGAPSGARAARLERMLRVAVSTG